MGHSNIARDAGAFYDALSDLIRVYQFRDRDRICCHDISVTQCYALDALVRNEALTLNELAAHLYLDKSTVSRVVATVEKKGLARRRKDEEDARSIRLEPTARGRALHARIRAEIEAREERLLSEFDPQLRVAMIDLVRRLAHAAEERVETGGGVCCSLD